MSEQDHDVGYRENVRPLTVSEEREYKSTLKTARKEAKHWKERCDVLEMQLRKENDITRQRRSRQVRAIVAASWTAVVIMSCIYKVSGSVFWSFTPLAILIAAVLWAWADRHD